jgi:16S rRNA (adenine1518-N6/adenine1519-N6)-dimethyltransferase
MTLILKKFIKNLFKKHKIFPLKRFGQNFLISKLALSKIIKAANLKANDVVLEIGPGIGTITKELAKKVKKVILIEKDQRLIEILKENLSNFKNLKIIFGDIREIEICKLKIKNYKVVANLPYYLTAPVIRKFLEAKYPPKEMILTIQKEVAKRICQKKKLNILAIAVQFYSKAEIVDYILKNSFWPKPKVDGAIIKLKVKRQKSKVNKDLFFKIVKTGFCQPRKQLINNLVKFGKKEKIKSWLLKNKISPSKRPEDLSIKDWQNLTKTFPF